MSRRQNINPIKHTLIDFRTARCLIIHDFYYLEFAKTASTPKAGDGFFANKVSNKKMPLAGQSNVDS
jgi:hypothetical protein